MDLVGKELKGIHELLSVEETARVIFVAKVEKSSQIFTLFEARDDIGKDPFIIEGDFPLQVGDTVKFKVSLLSTKSEYFTISDSLPTRWMYVQGCYKV